MRPAERARLVGRARERASEFLRGKGIPARSACLWLAYYGALELGGAGLRPLLQAGSAGWPRVRAEDDDGVRLTHFSYIWSPGEPVSRLALSYDRMPEMHVWIGLPETGEIVDLASGLFPAQAAAIMGWDWPEDLFPPPFFWGGPEDLARARACYEAHPEAIALALSWLGRVFGREALSALLALGRPGAPAAAPASRKEEDACSPPIAPGRRMTRPAVPAGGKATSGARAP